MATSAIKIVTDVWQQKYTDEYYINKHLDVPTFVYTLLTACLM